MATEPQQQVDEADAQKSADAVSNQTLAAPEAPKKAPAKRAAKKTASKAKASMTASPQKKAAAKAEGSKRPSKADKIDDRPVTRSGLFSPTQDDLNPAFAAPQE